MRLVNFALLVVINTVFFTVCYPIGSIIWGYSVTQVKFHKVLGTSLLLAVLFASGVLCCQHVMSKYPIIKLYLFALCVFGALLLVLAFYRGLPGLSLTGL